MAKKKLQDYIDRAGALEITLGGKETIAQLKDLIQKDMESLDTWDGDHFENKAAAPAEEPPKTKDDDGNKDSNHSADETPEDGAGEESGGEAPAENEEGDASSDSGAAESEGNDKNDVDDEELQAKVDDAVDHMNKPNLVKLAEELNVKKTGTVANIVERLAAIETDDMALAIDALDLWPEEEAEISEETAAARAERELIAKREKVQEEGIEAAMKMVNYFQACDDLEGALDLVVLSMDLWPKSSELSSRRKTLMTLIDDRDTAKTAYELEQSQAKLEKKNKDLMKSRGRAAKEITNDQCVDAVNAAITVIRDRARQQHLKGKASVRYRSAAQILTRVVGLNLR